MKWIEIVFVLLMGGVLFWPARNVPYYYDDYPHFVENRRILNPHNASDIFRNGLQETRPVYNLSLAGQGALAGTNARAAHMGNIALHTANAALLFLLLSREIGPGLIPFFSSVVFLCHPATIESVAYFNSRSTLLAVLFGLLSLLLLFSSRRALRVLGIAALILAIGSKEDGIVSVGWILLLHLWRLRKGRPALSMPFLFASLGTLVTLPLLYLLFRSPHVNSIGAGVENPFLYLWKQGVYVPLHLSVFFIPWPLTLDRDLPSWLFSPWLVATGWILMGGLVVGVWRKLDRIWALGLAMALIGLAPTHSVVPLLDLQATRVLYPMLVGLSLFTVAFLNGVWFERKRLTYVLSIGLVFLMASLARGEIRVWMDPVALWRRDAHFAPSRFRSWVNYAIELGERGRWDEAESAIGRAAALEPHHPSVLYNAAVINGTRPGSKRDVPLALRELNELLRIDPAHERGKALKTRLERENPAP
ncbi:MAG: tetratricopeptide repeat protein [Pseudomonadota bacterium]